MNIPPDEIPYFVGVFLFILFVREGMAAPGTIQSSLGSGFAS